MPLLLPDFWPVGLKEESLQERCLLEYLIPFIHEIELHLSMK